MPVNSRPSFQFYPNDWLADGRLNSCSLAAQGLWVKLLCLMHQGEPYGYIDFLDFSKWKPKDEPFFDRICACNPLARVLGADEDEIDEAMTELSRAGVFSVDNNGKMYSRRMVRDASRVASRLDQLTQRAPAGGRARAASAKRNKTGQFLPNATDPEPSRSQLDQRSPSPSPSPSSSKNKIRPSDDGPRLWDSVFHEKFWPAYPRKVSKDDALKAWRARRPRSRKVYHERCRNILRLLKARRLGEWKDRTPKNQPGTDFPYPATFLREESFDTADVEAACAEII